MSAENGGWPEKFNLFSFPRLRKFAQFLGSPVVREVHSNHYRGAAEMLDAHLDIPTRVHESYLESFIGREVALGHLTCEQALESLRTPEHPAEEINGYAEISDQLRYGLEDGQ